MSTAAGGKLRQHWDDRFLVRVYELRRSGIASKRAMAHLLGVYHETFNRWFEDKPALRDAWERGMAAREGRADFTFKDYVYQHLPAPLQAAWEEIEAAAGQPDAALRIEAMLGDRGDKARQRLFLHALTCNHFNPSVAARLVNVSKKTLKRWIAQDLEFGELMDEIEEIKDDFFNEKLIRLVDAEEPAAVLHVARTRLKGRGYGDSKDVNVRVEGSVNHNHAVLDLNKIVDRLTPGTQREILEAYRAYQLEAGVPLLPGTTIAGRVTGIHTED